MFIGRRADRSIYGAWTCEQPSDSDHPNVEELPDSHPEVLAFVNRQAPVAIDKREVAIDALLTATAKNADAPQAVKDFAASVK